MGSFAKAERFVGLRGIRGVLTCVQVLSRPKTAGGAFVSDLQLHGIATQEQHPTGVIVAAKRRLT